MSTPDYVDLAGVARMAGITVDSARTFHTRATRNRRNGNPRPGDMPEPDLVIGRSPAWKPETITAWRASKPGRGAGGGRAAWTPESVERWRNTRPGHNPDTP